MKANTHNTVTGVGFTGLLTILFIGLKLGHIIDWSWLWILSPLWIPAVLFLAFALGILVVVYVFKH
jgi:hypothetical protein